MTIVRTDSSFQWPRRNWVRSVKCDLSLLLFVKVSVGRIRWLCDTCRYLSWTRFSTTGPWNNRLVVSNKISGSNCPFLISFCERLGSDLMLHTACEQQGTGRGAGYLCSSAALQLTTKLWLLLTIFMICLVKKCRTWLSSCFVDPLFWMSGSCKCQTRRLPVSTS